MFSLGYDGSEMNRLFEPDNTPIVGPMPQPQEPATVLAVGLAEDDYDSLRGIFSNSTWRLHRSAGVFIPSLVASGESVSVMICERDIPGVDWKLIARGIRRMPDPPRFTVCSRLADDLLWAEVIAHGGEDILPLPFEAGEVLRVTFLAWLAWKRAGVRTGKESVFH